MSKKASTGPALKEQAKANAQSQKNFETQMKLMRKQMQSAEAIQLPAYEAPPPPPTLSSQDVQAAGRETRLQARRRYGFNQSISANNPTLGSATAL